MPTPVAHHTILVGRGITAAGVRQTLEDFAALGLVRNLIWIDADTFTHTGSTVRVMRRSEHGPDTRDMPLPQALSAVTGDVSFGLVNIVGGADDGQLGADTIHAITLALDSVGFSSRLHRTNLMLTVAGATPAGPLPLLRGYVNLLLAPEQSAGPDLPSTLIDTTATPGDIALHYAASIASIFGAWVGSGGAPASHMEHGQGDSFRLVRAYYRRIDGQAVQRAIKAGVFTTDPNPQAKLARPGQAVYAHHAPDARAFAAACAEEFMDEYRAVLTGPRYQAIAGNTVHTTASHALADFARAYGRNLATAPARWVRRVRYDVATARDYAVQKHLYGVTGSRVLVGRVGLATHTPDDTDAPLPTADIGTREDIAAELEPLWRSYSTMALTMIDAAPRAYGTTSAEPRYPAAAQEPGTSGILIAPRATHVVPGPDSRFGTLLPPQLKNLMGQPIAGYDIAGADAYEKQLAQLTGSQHRAIGRTIGDFRRWRDKHSHSFAARIGASIIQLGRSIEEEKQRYSADVTRLMQEQTPAGEHDDNSIKTLRFIGWVAITSLIVFLALWALGNATAREGFDPSWLWVRALNGAQASTKASFFSLWFATWLVPWLAQVALETRDDIKAANRRRTVRSDMHTAAENAAACDTALARIDVAYRQFVSTSHMLGAILHAPYGAVSVHETRVVTPANRMPGNVVLAEAQPTSDTVHTIIEQFRSGLYEEGWMSAHAADAYELAAATLHRSTGATIPTGHLMGLPGDGSGSALDQVATYFQSPDYHKTDRSQAPWRRIVEQLSAHNPTHTSPLLTPGDNDHHTTLTPLADVTHTGTFNGHFLTESGQTLNRIGPIDKAYYTRGSSTIDAIGGGEVLVQLSRSAHDSDITLHPHTPTPQPTTGADNFRSDDFFREGDL